MRTKSSILMMSLTFSGLFFVNVHAAAPIKEVITTKEAPAAIGPYSQAVRAGNMLFIAGQIPIDPKTGQLIQGSDEDQVKQVLENIRAILSADGMTMDNVNSETNNVSGQRGYLGQPG